MESNSRTVIIFDGYCILCNRIVDFILKNEKNSQLLFSTVQSQFSQEILKNLSSSYLTGESVFLIEDKKIYEKSTAVLKIFKYLKFPWPLLSFLRIIPTYIRDLIYDVIAKNRYFWFGKKQFCRVPDSQETARFR